MREEGDQFTTVHFMFKLFCFFKTMLGFFET